MNFMPWKFLLPNLSYDLSTNIRWGKRVFVGIILFTGFCLFDNFNYIWLTSLIKWGLSTEKKNHSAFIEIITDLPSLDIERDRQVESQDKFFCRKKISKVKIFHNWVSEWIFHHSVLRNVALSSLALCSTPLSPPFTGKNWHPFFGSFSHFKLWGKVQHHLNAKLPLFKSRWKVMAGCVLVQIWHFYPLKLLLQNVSIDNLIVLLPGTR